MRFFRYQASDGSGTMREGSIRAESAEAAMEALRQSGFTVASLDGQSIGAPPIRTVAAPARPTATPPVPIRAAKAKPSSTGPLIITRGEAPAAMVINTPAPSAPTRIFTRQGTDKDRFFLFAQLAAAFRAGINPAQALHEISARTKPYYRDSLLALAATATEGGDLAGVMEHYPDLYPEHVVGVTRAGQHGGFLAEAFEEVSRQAESAHKFKRWFFWIWFVAVNALISIPGMWWAMRSLLRTWEKVDANGGEGGPAAAQREVFAAFLEQLKWPAGPVFLGICAVVYLLYRYFGSRVTKRFRHKIGLKFPVYGKRARHENLARFSWTLTFLSRAGIAPANSYRMAADTVPNLEMREMLREVAGRLSGAEKMSDILNGARIFPEEYAPIVATAEYTGDLSGAFDQLTRSSQSEFESAQMVAKARSGCWGALGCFVTSAIMLGMLWYTWYYELPAKILDGMQP